MLNDQNLEIISSQNSTINEHVAMNQFTCDKVLKRFINYRIPHSYVKDSYKTYCSICENKHDMNIINRWCSTVDCEVSYKIQHCSILKINKYLLMVNMQLNI